VDEEKRIWGKAVDAAKKAGERVEAAAEDAWEKTRDVAGAVGEAVEAGVDRVDDIAEDAWEKTREAARDVGELASKTLHRATRSSGAVDTNTDGPETGEDGGDS